MTDATKPMRQPIDADKLDAAFDKALKADFDAHGESAIEAMRAEKPTDYVKIVAARCTKNAGEAADPLRDMSDAELDRHIDGLARRAGYEIRRVVSPHREGPAGDEGADTD